MPFERLLRKILPASVPTPTPVHEPVDLVRPARIPHNLHFIWVGALVPYNQAQNLCRWVEENPAYEVYFWTEACSTENNALRVYSILKGIPFITAIDIARGDNAFKIECDRADGQHSTLFIHPITILPNFCDMAQVYEEIHTWRNYGAASDILRIAVLHEYGGIYMDFDTYSRGTPLPTNIIAPKGILFAGANPEDRTEYITNAIIAAPQYASELKELSDLIKDKYETYEYPTIAPGIKRFTESAQNRLHRLAKVRQRLKKDPDNPEAYAELLNVVKFMTIGRSGPIIIEFWLVYTRKVELDEPEVEVYYFQKESGANLYIASEATWIK